MPNYILLYDYERDKDLEVGQAILVFEDGTTKRIRESSLYEREAVNVRDPANVQRLSPIRSRTTREVKHRAKDTKQAPPRKRLALYKA